MKTISQIVLAALAIIGSSAAAQTVHVVKMKSRGEGGLMVFEPAYIHAKVGDTVRFLPTDPGHNAVTIAGILPNGGMQINGAINQPVDLKLTREGLYGIQCKPHLGLGMIALVQAGRALNLAQAKSTKLPPLATRRMAQILAKVN